jgi:hypothetical protein
MVTSISVLGKMERAKGREHISSRAVVATQDISIEERLMDTEPILGKMEINTRGTGRTINVTDMVN